MSETIERAIDRSFVRSFDRAEEESLRIGVHIADAVVWGPVYRKGSIAKSRGRMS